MIRWPGWKGKGCPRLSLHSRNDTPATHMEISVSSVCIRNVFRGLGVLVIIITLTMFGLRSEPNLCAILSKLSKQLFLPNVRRTVLQGTNTGQPAFMERWLVPLPAMSLSRLAPPQAGLSFELLKRDDRWPSRSCRPSRARPVHASDWIHAGDAGTTVCTCPPCDMGAFQFQNSTKTLVT